MIRCAPVFKPAVLVKLETCAQIPIRTLRCYFTSITSEEACVPIPNQDVFAASLEGFVRTLIQVIFPKFPVFERKNVPVNPFSVKPMFGRKKCFIGNFIATLESFF